LPNRNPIFLQFPKLPLYKEKQEILQSYEKKLFLATDFGRLTLFSPKIGASLRRTRIYFLGVATKVINIGYFTRNGKFLQGTYFPFYKISNKIQKELNSVILFYKYSVVVCSN